tara:strand:+ start:1765 stop:2718 length:954 start_codon:yes stop_codon:yes gene_type:complete
MDPFTLALATFGVQKLRGKSTKKALQSAALIGGGAYALGAMAPTSSLGQMFAGKAPLSSIGLGGSQTYGATQGLKTIPGSDLFGKQFMKPEVVQQIAKSSPLSEAVVGAGAEGAKKGIASNLLTKVKDNPLQSAFLASSIIPLLASEDEGDGGIDGYRKEDYDKAYAEQSDKLEGAFVPAQNTRPTRDETLRSDMFYANEGGLATAIKKFNKGGINYLPSKTDHNENDYNNYVRAEGYVEDGAGNGDKDEDTMLAQLADGEFVSRADAVLGAGILSGGDPKSFKSMRKAGADFFYDQQKKLKRIYDLVNDNKSNTIQ